MALDIEHGALCRIITDRDIATAIEMHLGDEYFEDPANLRVWKMITEHWKDHGSVPDITSVNRAYPTFTVYAYPEPLRYYLDELRDRKRMRIALAATQEAMKILDDEGPDKGRRFADTLRNGLQTAWFEVPEGKDVDYFTMFQDNTLERLIDRVNNPGLRGVETGFDILDKITGGYQDGQLISIVAVPKTGKSTLALYSALHVRSVGRRAMFFTFEMSAAEQEDRLVSMVSGVDYNAILDGTLTQLEIDQIAREHKLREYSHEGLTLVADTSSVTTVSAIQAKIRQYKPRVVFVDGAYLMDDEEGEAKGSSQALTNITRALKRMAQAESIPVILTTQGSQFRAKGGVNMSTAMYSQSFAQDSDVLLGAEKLLQRKDGLILSKFSVIEGRNVRKANFYIEVDWSHGSIRHVTDAEAEIMLASADPNAPAGGANPNQSFQMGP